MANILLVDLPVVARQDNQDESIFLDQQVPVRQQIQCHKIVNKGRRVRLMLHGCRENDGDP